MHIFDNQKYFHCILNNFLCIETQFNIVLDLKSMFFAHFMNRNL